MSTKRHDTPTPDFLEGVIRDGLIRLRVRPGKKRDVLFQSGDGLAADIASPAHDGKANKRLVWDLSRWLDCPPSRIRVEKGLTSREKAVSVAGMEDEEIRERLAQVLVDGPVKSLPDSLPSRPANRT